MPDRIKIFGDQRSGNCLKVKWTADFVGRTSEWIDVLAGSGATQDPAFLAINPAAQVPVVILPDGRALAQSNAILLFLAEGTKLVPSDHYERARMWEWMFWEQYSHEPSIAVRRWQLSYLNIPVDQIDPSLLVRGNRALTIMEARLGQTNWFAGAGFSCADIALLAYTRMAGEGGFVLIRASVIGSNGQRVF
jgi:glutathione S-transferase